MTDERKAFCFWTIITSQIAVTLKGIEIHYVYSNSALYTEATKLGFQDVTTRILLQGISSQEWVQIEFKTLALPLILCQCHV